MQLPLQSQSKETAVVDSYLPGMILLLQEQAELRSPLLGSVVILNLGTDGVVAGFVVEVESVSLVINGSIKNRGVPLGTPQEAGVVPGGQVGKPKARVVEEVGGRSVQSSS